MPPFPFLRRGRVTKAAGELAPVVDQLAVQRAAAEAQSGPVGPFSPGVPIAPAYRDAGSRPRTFDFRTGYNIVARPDRDRRVSFSVLRDLIDHYDVARMAVGHRIDDVRSLDWRILPEDGITADVSGAVEIARRKLKRPDGVHPFATWVAMYLEDVLRYDAGCLWKQRDRAGRVLTLKVIDGTTIAPLLDYYGDTPTGDAPAFVQYVAGTPWQWLRSADVIYQPFRPQTNSPYGFAPLEAVLLTANTDVRFQMHFLNYFTEGTIPAGFAQLPGDISTPEQIRQFQDYYDALLYGDEAAKHQIRWVPAGTTFDWPRNETFDAAFPMFLMRKVCASYHVTPNDLGFTDDVNRSSSEAQIDVQARVGTKPLVTHLKGIVDDFLQVDLGLPVQIVFDLGEEKEDRVSEAQAHKIYIEAGVESADEVRSEVLGLPVDESRPVPRFIMASRLGPIPLDSLFAIAGPVDPTTAAPAEAEPLRAAPFDPAGGVVADKLPGAQVFHRAPINPDDPARPALEHPVPGSDVIAPPAPAQKAQTAGITGATGIAGVDLGGGTLNPRPVLPGDVDDDGEQLTKALDPAAPAPTAAGLAVIADDTGRVLLLQRALDDTDPAAGTWEFPGGHLEAGEDAFTAAVREWQEETGCRLPAGVAGGSWTSPNGVYAGCTWVIPSEDALSINPEAGRVLNPDDPDGDAAEVCAWWDTDQLEGLSALRGELAADLGSVLPVLEAAHLGDGDAIRKELRRWRSNARTRVAKGLTPRRFASDVLPAGLLEQFGDRLAGSITRQQVDEAFAQVIRPKGEPVAPVRKSWRDGFTHPLHAFDLRLTDYYAPKIAAGLGRLWNEERLTAAIAAAGRQVTKAADPMTDRVLGAVRDALGAGDTADLESVMRQAFVDGWAAGGHVAAEQLAELGDRGGSVATLNGIGEVDWNAWQPGHPGAAALVANGGLRDLLDEAEIRIKGLSGTTVDQIGNKIADGIAAGHDVDRIGRSLRPLLAGNASRAEMIAHTETARAMTAATLATYDANGLREWNLVISAGACPVCVDVQAGGPYSVEQTDVAPPLHPRCRCAAAPVVASAAAGTGSTAGPDYLGDALTALGDVFGGDAADAAAGEAEAVDEAAGEAEAVDEAAGETAVDEAAGETAVDEAAGETAVDEAEAEAGEPAAGGGAGDLAALSDDDLAELLGEADDDTAERIMVELDRRDAADAAAAEEPAETAPKPGSKAAAKAAREAELEARWDAAIAAGEDAEESYARIYGVDVDRMRRDEAIASLRAQGYTGRGFDELVRAAFRDYAEQAYWQAEAETRGNLLSRAAESDIAGGRLTLHPRELFEGPESRARKYASEELRAWWDEHGRLTFDDFRASLLGGHMRWKGTGYFL